MKITSIASILSVILFVSTMRTSAQFYAPDTEYHDQVQRVYVVEAARVLAWWSDRTGTNISEVTYHLATGTNQVTTWDVHWLDKNGKEVKSAVVSYGADTLKGGPEFYRVVFKKLWAAGWKAAPRLTSSDLTTGFWRGAARMGVSREESLGAAFAIEKDVGKRADKDWVPQLAGLLAHAALPGYGSRVSLDDLLLARGAAWLALAEVGVGTNRDELWAPIVYQAGRERSARELWQRNAPNTTETVEQAAWNLWMSKPVSKEIYLFATTPSHLGMALPMIAHDVVANGTGRIFGDLLPELAGSVERLAELHNYAPFVVQNSGVIGGHLLNGQWPDVSRRAWMRLLIAFPRGHNDYGGYEAILRSTAAALAHLSAEPELPDRSLIGIHEVAPLLRLAREEGVGKLIPTGMVTARDLLNYGWEMAGVQMGGRYNFVAHSWFIPELAQAIEKSATTELEGVESFFTNGAPDIQKFTAGLGRLQMCGPILVGTNTPAYDAGPSRLENARLFIKRCWLNPKLFWWQARALRANGAESEISDLIEAFRAEDAGEACRTAMIYLIARNAEEPGKIPGADELKKSLAEAAVEPNEYTVHALESSTYHGMRNFDFAQTLERLYWKYPDSGLEYRIAYNYAVSGAFDSAIRFYSEFRTNGDEVLFSGAIGEMLYMLCYVSGQEALASNVVDDCLGGSAEQMNVEEFAAALHGDADQIRDVIEGRMSRYDTAMGNDAADKRLLGFLPLLPGLSDPASPLRPQALDYFRTNVFAPTMQWLWIQRYKLPDADAIRFLGGPTATNAYIRVLLTYYQRDPRQNRVAVNQFMTAPATPYQAVIARHLFKELHSNAQRHQDEDLRPPVVETIRVAVRKKLRAGSQ